MQFHYILMDQRRRPVIIDDKWTEDFGNDNDLPFIVLFHSFTH